MKLIKILSILIIVFITIYIVTDKSLFFYGKNDLNIYNPLPMKIKPEYRPEFEGGFTIWDEYGLSIAGKGVKFVNSDIEVNQIIKYGYNNDRVVVQVEDNLGNNILVEFTEDSNQDIEVNFLENEKSNELDWVQIQKNESQIQILESIRNYSLFIIIALIFIITYKIFIRRNTKKRRFRF